MQRLQKKMAFQCVEQMVSLVLSFFVVWGGIVFSPSSGMAANPVVNNQLLLAIERDQLEEVKKAITAGADSNCRAGHRGMSALMMASLRGDYQIVRYLVEQGAEIEAKATVPEIPCRDFTALAAAIAKNHPEIVRYLLHRQANSRIVFSFKAFQAVQPLQLAAGLGFEQIVRLLLEQGVSGDHRALIIAAENDQLPVVRLLVEQGVALDETDSAGMTALAAACYAGNPLVVGYLLEHKAKRSGRFTVDSHQDMTLLMLAAASNRVEKSEAVIELLLAYGLEINACNRDGSTALHIAVANNHPEIVKMLLKQGADPTIKDNAGHSVLGQANKQKTQGISTASAQTETEQQPEKKAFRERAAQASTPTRPEEGDPRNAEARTQTIVTLRERIWQLGSALSLVAVSHAQGISEGVIQRMMTGVQENAHETLAMSFPPLPRKTGDSETDKDSIIDYLLETAGKPINRVIGMKWPQRREELQSLFDVALKSNMLVLLYAPETKELNQSFVSVIEQKGLSAGLPPSSWSRVVHLIEQNGSLKDLTRAVSAMHSNISFLLQRELR